MRDAVVELDDGGHGGIGVGVVAAVAGVARAVVGEAGFSERVDRGGLPAGEPEDGVEHVGAVRNSIARGPPCWAAMRCTSPISPRRSLGHLHPGKHPAPRVVHQHGTPAASTVAIMRSASASVEAMGFSQMMPRTPAATASTTICAWRSSGVATLMTSSCSRANISR